MKSSTLVLAALFSSLCFNFLSCTEKSYDVKPQPVNLDLGQLTSDPQMNLGRVLFYDNHLSVNNSISCASCHKQALGFADNAAFSSGFENRLTLRNSIPIQNLSCFSCSTFVPTLFWDGRANFLTSMVLMPILNHVEMGMSDEDALVDRIRNVPYYNDLFTKAYGSSTVSSSGIAQALGYFVGQISSTQTRFDQQTLSTLELQGQGLFMTKYNCNSCHQVISPHGYENGGTNGDAFANIGLDKVYADNGRGGFTHVSTDFGKFKIPCLRNVALTAPYMHDGRFATLNDVLNHYSHNIADHPNLDPRLRDNNGKPIQMNISDQEKTALIAFLNSMTDFNMISNPDFSNPFKIK